ncbi:hypothetical protein BJ944DRAFT_272720 [Cunninghamella echinulata]|nr:hypothetical protein BJ944DRAFT_272720 [Cunninghamella echinulata]
MKLSTISAIILGAAASCSASAVPRQTGGIKCNTGTAQCCNSLQSYNGYDPKVLNNVITIFGGHIQDTFKGQWGFGCTSVGVFGAAGQSCSLQPQCCEQVQANAGLAWNCSPVSVNL